MAVISFEMGEWQWLVRVPVDGRQAGGRAGAHSRDSTEGNGKWKRGGERREERGGGG